MTDKPIIFSAAMVRALIEGRKSQTRRVLDKDLFAPGEWTDDYVMHDGNAEWRERLIRWKVGDRLWVREAWRTFVSLDDVSPVSVLSPERGAGICYEAGGGASISRPPGRELFSDYSLEERHDRRAFGRLRAAMHMPRWASRLTLTVTDVRVQRLQEINEADAKAEGLEFRLDWLPQYRGSSNLPWRSEFACDAYADLWNALHGDGAWSLNPWVAAISFEVRKGNIDE